MGANSLTLYGIASCDTCRKARKWLTEQSREFRFHDLRNDGLDSEMLDRWAGRIDWNRLLNTRSLTWRKLPEVDRANMTMDKVLALMLEHPTLVKRPVLECSKFIAVGFAPKNYRDIFMQV